MSDPSIDKVATDTVTTDTVTTDKVTTDKVATDKTTDLLMKLQCGSITLRECQAQLQVTQAPEKSVHYKVSTKGCISFYGIRRMPISLYLQELEQLLGAIIEDPTYLTEFERFIEDNKDALRQKAGRHSD